jgi:hypothetical protein
MVITNFVGMHVNSANVGAGFKSPDGTYNVSGTVIGLGQTAHSVVDFALTGVKNVSKWVPGVGAGLGLFGVVDSYNKITDSLAKGQSPAQSDIAGVLGGAASMTGGAALILGGSVVVPIAVMAGVVAGTWQLVASAKSLTWDDAAALMVERSLSDAQELEVQPTSADHGAPLTTQAGLGVLPHPVHTDPEAQPIITGHQALTTLQGQ